MSIRVYTWQAWTISPNSLFFLSALHLHPCSLNHPIITRIGNMVDFKWIVVLEGDFRVLKCALFKNCHTKVRSAAMKFSAYDSSWKNKMIYRKNDRPYVDYIFGFTQGLLKIWTEYSFNFIFLKIYSKWASGDANYTPCVKKFLFLPLRPSTPRTATPIMNWTILSVLSISLEVLDLPKCPK